MRWTFLNAFRLSDYDQKVSQRLLLEIITRLQFLEDVGLGYLSLNAIFHPLRRGIAADQPGAITLQQPGGSMYIWMNLASDCIPDTQRLIKF